MAQPPLYALQKDVDMIAIQVNNLTKALSDLDLILKRTEDLALEQLCQGAQMDRMAIQIKEMGLRLDKIELRLDRVEKRLDRIEERMDRIEERMDRIEERMDRIEERMDKIEQRMDRMEKLLLLICKKLDINTAV